MLRRDIGDYHFLADKDTGLTMRWGRNLQEDPTFAPVPELADISISNHCTKGCSFCYKDSKDNKEFLSVDDYCYVLDSMNDPQYGNVFQVALGGGEPLEHPCFNKIIDETIKRNIVPNFTTNGIHVSEEVCKHIRGKVGAVAISTTSFRNIPTDKISLLRAYNIKVNLHFVLSSENIEEATSILRDDGSYGLEGINAIIFLTFKPAGRGNTKYVIRDKTSVKSFLDAVVQRGAKLPRIGFDACFVPMLMNGTNINRSLIDSCEGGSFSVYIDHKMNVSPCSFSSGKDAYSLKNYSFYEIWLNKFKKFREKNKNLCRNYGCDAHDVCRGYCPYYPEITTCYVH